MNPKSDKFGAHSFHHVEFYSGDAACTYRHFMEALGMDLAAKSDLSTGNNIHASYLLQSGEMRMLFTAPHDMSAATSTVASSGNKCSLPLPNFCSSFAKEFFNNHGLGVRAIAVTVDSVQEAFDVMTKNGGRSALHPTEIVDKSGRGCVKMAEIYLYGDVVLRLVQEINFKGGFLPNFDDVTPQQERFGKFNLERFDHIVGNVYDMNKTLDHMKKMTVGCGIVSFHFSPLSK